MKHVYKKTNNQTFIPIYLIKEEYIKSELSVAYINWHSVSAAVNERILEIEKISLFNKNDMFAFSFYLLS